MLREKNSDIYDDENRPGVSQVHHHVSARCARGYPHKRSGSTPNPKFSSKITSNARRSSVLVRPSSLPLRRVLTGSSAVQATEAILFWPCCRTEAHAHAQQGRAHSRRLRRWDRAPGSNGWAERARAEWPTPSRLRPWSASKSPSAHALGS
jgi:hypothetical protein